MEVNLYRPSKRTFHHKHDELDGLNISTLYGEDDELEDIESISEEQEEGRTFEMFTDSESDDEEEKPLHKVASQTLTSQQELVRYYEDTVYSGSDIDVFLYALSEEEAEKKIVQLYHQFKQNLIPEKMKNYTTFSEYYRYRTTPQQRQDICVIRTKQAVTFHFTYPIRPVQVILRIYKSPAEVLMGFDLDCCTIGYDGNQVWALPRARRAISSRMNLVDVDRQSTTYEVRLFKYAKRGFRVVCFSSVIYICRVFLVMMSQKLRTVPYLMINFSIF
jgi:hypothetical protein